MPTSADTVHLGVRGVTPVSAESAQGIFPEFTGFIPKNREYIAQLCVRSTRKKLGYRKLKGVPKRLYGALYTRYPIVARALGLAARASKGILHTIRGTKMVAKANQC